MSVEHPEGLPAGAYESLVTARLTRVLGKQNLEPSFQQVDPGDAPAALARHVASAAERALESLSQPDDRAALVNRLLELLGEEESFVERSFQRLVSLHDARAIGSKAFSSPLTPLSDAALLTNARHEPSLGTEVRSELASADRVDLLCAFIRWHGIRVLERPLSDLHERGIPFRVITTTYMGATERRALDELVNRFGAEVKISYEHQSTRLHAKAWLLERESSFTTAFVGSSNLSKSALLDGLEWNVRLSAVATPRLLDKFAATFETYWEDPAFVHYDPLKDGQRLDEALGAAGGSRGDVQTVTLAGLEVRALPHQEQILEALESEREVHDRHRNLVIAATGTGKTVVAALDYKQLAESLGRRPTLLFIAHRKEILEQSLRVYREVMSDGSFGEKYVGGDVPQAWHHVFASIQSLSSADLDRFAPHQFDVIVMDEFHHAQARTYRTVLEHFKPMELLGLTATPERADGIDVRDFFDGRAAFELPLWDALAADLLVPFHYFGVADDTDLNSVEWSRGRYDVEGLDRLYTGNDARVSNVIREVRDKVANVTEMRGLGFCVSVAHAEYMARKFSEAGIPSIAVSASSSSLERSEALAALRERQVNVLFAVDLFNEGLDIPQVDTVLFLRPTQSATIFLQQLGRGLRRSPGKAVLTVLDFIGQHRKEFRMDLRYQALLGTSRRQVLEQIEKGFPFLPSGSQLVLDRVSQEIVLDNVRQHLRANRSELVRNLSSVGDVRLGEFVQQTGHGIDEIYRGKGSWTYLRQAAELPVAALGPASDGLLSRVRKLAHVDDQERADLYTTLLSENPPPYRELASREQTLARMLYFLVWPRTSEFSSFEEGLRYLSRHRASCDEGIELLQLSFDRTRLAPGPIGEGLQHVPLTTHSHYHRDEILAAFGWASWERGTQGHVTGVAWAEKTSTDALLVNLVKSEADFSPTTMYRDYAISPELFHWESQNTTSEDSPTGQRYIHHDEMGSHVVLFARHERLDALGSAPFMCLGQATYVSHRGNRPMSITWRLKRPMPGQMFQDASVVAH